MARSDAATPPGLDAGTLCEAFQRTAATFATRPALRTHGNRSWIRWDRYASRVDRIAAGLYALGIRRGDTLALMLGNRPEFQLIDTAALHLGAVPFSIYNTSAPEQVAHVLGNACARIAICEPQYASLLGDCGGGKLERILVLDEHLDELERTGRSSDFDFEAAWHAVAPDDIATLIYTSGTTGPPKGVELTHGALLFVMRGIHELWGLRPAGRTISYLPHAHIADRLSSHYISMVAGTSITCVRELANAVPAIAHIRPTHFMAVPRTWEKLHAALLAQADEAFHDAVAVGLETVRSEQAGQAMDAALTQRWRLAEQRVLSPLRTRLGFDELDWAVTGAAPITNEVHAFFLALGIGLCEVWGLSESASITTTTRIDQIRIGSVGQPLPGVELRLCDDGEVLLRGPNLMRGYRNDPERTAEAIDADGWLHTGDVGHIDADGHLKIVDRKKELIINAAGKNMSPVNIETALKAASPLIGQACVVGDRRPYNVALLVLDRDACAAHAKADKAPAMLCDDPKVRNEIARAVDRANARLSRVEQIKRYALLSDEWPPDGDELTPTMKLKRRGVYAKYAATIDKLYAARASAPAHAVHKRRELDRQP